MLELNSMTKIDQLISVFKELKDELNKNVNQSYSAQPNAATGTSGGQGGMYRSEMEKQTMNPSAGGAQDSMMMSEVVKFDKNGQWSMEKANKRMLGGKHFRQWQAEQNKLKPHELKEVSNLSSDAHSPKDHPSKLSVKDAQKLTRSADELANGIIEKLEKACSVMKDDHNISSDGKNREANPKLRQSDLGPGGKIHMIKEEAEKCEGTNQEANPSYPHNKGKFKVMPMAPEKSEKHASPDGKPYNGKDKEVKKDEDVEKMSADDIRAGMAGVRGAGAGYKPAPIPKPAAPAVKPATIARPNKGYGAIVSKEETKKSDKKKIGHIQGNDVRGNDENKAPGRGTLSV